MEDRIWLNDKEYEIRHRIGRGGGGEIFLFREVKDKPKVIVVKSPNPDYPKILFNNEIYIMDQIKNEFNLDENSKSIFPAILGFNKEENYFKSSYIAMTCEPHSKNLSQIVTNINHDDKFLPVNHANNIMKKLYDADDKIHKLGFVHGDLKLENTLITNDGRIVLLDFGITQKIGGKTIGGTLNYSSPETDEKGIITEASDVYSLGIIYYELLTGENNIKELIPTYSQENLFSVINKEEKSQEWKRIILELKKERKIGQYHIIEPINKIRGENIPKGIENIIKESLNPNPKNRPTIKEIQERMERISTDYGYESLENEDVIRYFKYYMRGEIPPSFNCLAKKAKKLKKGGNKIFQKEKESKNRISSSPANSEEASDEYSS